MAFPVIPMQIAKRRRRFAAALVAIALGGLGCGPATAGDWRGRGMRAPAFRGPQFAHRAVRQDRMPRGPQQREMPPQPPPSVPFEQPTQPPRFDPNERPGRMTPDERRALRQQINDAGREIYRAPRP